MHALVRSRAAPGMPCGRAGARPTRCHTAPACKIGDPVAHLESLVEKHLTQNQMLSGVHSADQSPRPRSALPYSNWYINGYGPPWTSSDPNPKIRPHHGRICT